MIGIVQFSNSFYFWSNNRFDQILFLFLNVLEIIQRYDITTIEEEINTLFESFTLSTKDGGNQRSSIYFGSNLDLQY